jgi:hypothetical protein
MRVCSDGLLTLSQGDFMEKENWRMEAVLNGKVVARTQYGTEIELTLWQRRIIKKFGDSVSFRFC